MPLIYAAVLLLLTDPAMNLTPSYTEFDGYYNVRPDPELRPEIARTRYLQTAANVPPLSFDETWEVRGEVLEILYRMARPKEITEKDAREREIFWVGEEPNDRTALVELPDNGALTLNTLKALQSEVLRKRQLWRVFFKAESPKTVIIVYPTKIRIGDEQNENKAALQRVVQKNLDLEHERTGPERRQLDHLRTALKRSHLGPDAPACTIPAAFDSYRGDFEELSIWSLQKGKEADIRPYQPNDVPYSDWYPVYANGSIGDWRDSKSTADFWLVQWILPKKQSPRRLSFRDKRTGEEWHFDLKNVKILLDADLKKTATTTKDSVGGAGPKKSPKRKAP